jgi:WhiB family transcriptional regulator, redox-sensing transcriptional regulator
VKPLPATPTVGVVPSIHDTLGETMTVTSLDTTHSTGWQAHAACRGEKGHDFYPPVTGERRRERRLRETRAKSVCTLCPVRSECLEMALANDEQYGVWGGLTTSERRSLAAAAASCPTASRDSSPRSTVRDTAPLSRDEGPRSEHRRDDESSRGRRARSTGEAHTYW